MNRVVAQFGSALDWGSRGRRFKSCQPDQLSQAGQMEIWSAFFFPEIIATFAIALLPTDFDLHSKGAGRTPSLILE